MHRLLDGRIGDGDATEIALASTALVAVQVGLATLRTHNLARSRHFHALGGALLGFHLRHCCCPFCAFLTGRAVGLSPIQTEKRAVVYQNGGSESMRDGRKSAKSRARVDCGSKRTRLGVVTSAMRKIPALLLTFCVDFSTIRFITFWCVVFFLNRIYYTIYQKVFH